MADIDDLYRDPNGPAYQTKESRTGPPLVYVGEKLSSCLRTLHAAWKSVEEGTDAAAEVRTAFHFALVSFLALFNMLALAGSEREDYLLSLSHQDFVDWVEGIEREGSVKG